MNNQGQVVVTWGDDDYCFRLTVQGLIELEEKCAAPFSTVWERMNLGAYTINDIRETIRLGLIGGGKSPAEAVKLVRRYIDDQVNVVGMTEHVMIARVILLGVMFGFKDGAPGKVPAAPVPSESASTPPPSPEPPDLLDAALSSWGNLASGNFLQS